MKKITLFSSFLILLSGCAFSQIENGLTALKGEKIQTAFNYLGTPDNEQDIAGSKVYTWGRAFSATTITPVTTSTTGSAFSSYGGYANYYGTTTSYVPQTHNYSCTVKIITDQKGIITGGQFDGNLGGCASYGSALQKATKDLAPELLETPKAVMPEKEAL